MKCVPLAVARKNVAVQKQQVWRFPDSSSVAPHCLDEERIPVERGNDVFGPETEDQMIVQCWLVRQLERRKVLEDGSLKFLENRSFAGVKGQFGVEFLEIASGMRDACRRQGVCKRRHLE